jgi:putative PIN family toxin of toxin-antitoxin system
MYQVVLDTNVIAAAMLSRNGASHQLLRMVGDPRWQLNLSVPLALEYEQTLIRVCAGMPRDDLDAVLAHLFASARLRPIYFLWRLSLPDPGDHMVLELAVESRADFLVTFNRRDFVPASQFGIRIVTPPVFLAILREEP